MRFVCETKSSSSSSSDRVDSGGPLRQPGMPTDGDTKWHQ